MWVRTMAHVVLVLPVVFEAIDGMTEMLASWLEGSVSFYVWMHGQFLCIKIF
jgi:hypothetical protein